MRTIILLLVVLLGSSSAFGQIRRPWHDPGWVPPKSGPQGRETLGDRTRICEGKGMRYDSATGECTRGALKSEMPPAVDLRALCESFGRRPNFATGACF